MINSEYCIGCQACVEMCPTHAIAFSTDMWGEGRSEVDTERCAGCGFCEKICPNGHAVFYSIPKAVNAVISKTHRNTGSSGGVFYEIAKLFIANGGVVYGAAFNDDLKLIHKRATMLEELMSLCKSKYIHSNMNGVYTSIRDDLNHGRRVLFVGAPCQASAVKNLFSQQYADLLFIIDFLCHGTGTQRVFDACIHEEERKKKGKITSFCFRAKTRKAEHSFSYTIDCNGKKKIIDGYAFEFPYYYSFLNYTIFNDACYLCRYAQNARVGDITLGDFWGIQHYNSVLRDMDGVSMVAINSEKGKQLFSIIKKECQISQYPLHIATEHNQSFNHAEPCPKRKNELERILEIDGEVALVKAMSCPDLRKELLWAKMPSAIKQVYRKIRGRK